MESEPPLSIRWAIHDLQVKQSRRLVRIAAITTGIAIAALVGSAAALFAASVSLSHIIKIEAALPGLH